MLEHGGRLQRAVAATGIARERWLDLSTGINPDGWPLPEIPREVWTRLPEDDDGLEAIAASYYGAPQLLATAGSQAAIRCLARSRARCTVGVIAPGYAEHAHAWQQAGHRVHCEPAGPLLQKAATHDVIVLIHPNNPGADRFERAQLLDLHAQLHARGGWLIVDEAFMDATPEHSVIDRCDRPGLIVLRSPGKFFGLAGARAGFVAAEACLLQSLREALGPWCVANPTRWLLRQAFADHAWQTATREHLQRRSLRLHDVLSVHGLVPDGSAALFHWIKTPYAHEIHMNLQQSAILTRYFDAPSSLRLGLPSAESDWQRLSSALAGLPRKWTGAGA